MKHFLKVKNSFPFLLLVFLICSCSPGEEIEIEPNPPIVEMDRDSISYLALGDSYTIGQGVSPSDRWPLQLREVLNDQERVITPVDIIARTGWTTRNLLTAIDQAKPEPHDLVSLLIGVNNQFQNRPFEEFKVEFDTLLDISISIAGTKDRVFVVSIPDYGVTPFGKSNQASIAAELDTYNAFMDQQCQQQGIPFINITDISRSLGNGPEALAPDDLHPSAEQYKAWVNRIRPVVEALLK